MKYLTKKFVLIYNIFKRFLWQSVDICSSVLSLIYAVEAGIYWTFDCLDSLWHSAWDKNDKRRALLLNFIPNFANAENVKANNLSTIEVQLLR